MKISLCLNKHSAMISYGDVRFWLFSFLTLALAGVKWVVHNQVFPPPGKTPPVPMK